MSWDFLSTILLTATLVSVNVLFHYEGLRILSHALSSMTFSSRTHMLTIILGVFLIHMLEIGFYAMGYWFAVAALNIGSFTGLTAMTARDLFYFSAVTYTTLGYGDILPIGDLRLFVSIESLNGVLLLGWTTSYTFVAMQQYWTVSDALPPDLVLQKLTQKRYKSRRMNKRSAQILGLEALRWLAGDGDALERFLSATGVDADALRRGVGRRDTTIAVFDFLLLNHDLMLRFCESAHVEEKSIRVARKRFDEKTDKPEKSAGAAGDTAEEDVNEDDIEDPDDEEIDLEEQIDEELVEELKREQEAARNPRGKPPRKPGGQD